MHRGFSDSELIQRTLITYEKEINLLTYFYHSPMVIAKSCSFLL
jgi:hypothetical protein